VHQAVVVHQSRSRRRREQAFRLWWRPIRSLLLLRHEGVFVRASYVPRRAIALVKVHERDQHVGHDDVVDAVAPVTVQLLGRIPLRCTDIQRSAALGIIN
jgi:hypothetical protein